MNPLPTLSDNDIDRFWQKVAVSAQDACWDWSASCFRDGYGQFKASGKNLKAHRVAFYLHHGIDPLQNLVCHSCDNRRCCNPAHMFLGTPRDNAHDAIRKNRFVAASGDQHGSRTKPESRARGERIASSVLTATEVRLIRDLYAGGEMTQSEIAARFRVTREAISRIITGRNWAHIVKDGEPKSLTTPIHRSLRGTSNPSAKLTAEEVVVIRRSYDEGDSTQALAARYHVSNATIRHIVKRLTWKHLS